MCACILSLLVFGCVFAASEIIVEAVVAVLFWLVVAGLVGLPPLMVFLLLTVLGVPELLAVLPAGLLGITIVVYGWRHWNPSYPVPSAPD